MPNFSRGNVNSTDFKEYIFKNPLLFFWLFMWLFTCFFHILAKCLKILLFCSWISKFLFFSGEMQLLGLGFAVNQSLNNTLGSLAVNGSLPQGLGS